MDDKTHRIVSYRTILSWINKGRQQADSISYDSLRTHAKRHYELDGIMNYLAAQMDKDLRNAVEDLRNRAARTPSATRLPLHQNE